MGPAKIQTHGGCRYFLSIIDYFSKNLWLFVLKLKSGAFEKFKDRLILTKNRLDRKLKHLRTNNGLEYTSENFDRLCKSK